MYGRPGDPDWVLVDTGVRTSADEIMQCAQQRYGSGVPPAPIVLTQGHIDHVGSGEALAQSWGRASLRRDATAAPSEFVERFAL